MGSKKTSNTILRNGNKYWPESSGLGNVADFWLATLPLALPPKIFLHFSLHYAILSQKVFGGNAIGNVVNQKLATLPRPDDSGQYLSIDLPSIYIKMQKFRIGGSNFVKIHFDISCQELIT